MKHMKKIIVLLLSLGSITTNYSNVTIQDVSQMQAGRVKEILVPDTISELFTILGLSF
jgi:hypothetical protein